MYRVYDTLCQLEWDWSEPTWGNLPTWDKLKNSEDFKKVGGQAAYARLRPYFYARGILDPPLSMNGIRTSVSFLGEVRVTGGLHPRMVAVLQRAEKAIAGFPIIGGLLRRSIIDNIPLAGPKGKQVHVIGGWFPRPIEGGGLSAHALGLAVDINAPENPHLKGALASAIDAVLDYLQSLGKFSGPHRIGKPIVDLKSIARAEEDSKGDGVAVPEGAIQSALAMWTQLSLISEAFQSFVQENLPKYLAGELVDPVLGLMKRCTKAFGVGGLQVVARDGVTTSGLLW
jgi:hypothetical protein